jgi:two-component system response regulator NreC
MEDSDTKSHQEERRRGDRRVGDRRAVGAEDSAPKLTVMLVDSEALVRSAIAELLRNEPGIEVVAESSSAAKAKQVANGHKPQIILFAPPLETESASVTEEITRLREVSPDSKLIVLTGSEDPVFARDVLRAGAVGYMLTREEPEDLLKAILRASKGTLSISPSVVVQIARLDTQNGDGDLTDREKEILRLVALGHTSNEIAEQLFLSARTVESHRANMIRKLDVDSRAGLVRYAIDNGLVS